MYALCICFYLGYAKIHIVCHGRFVLSMPSQKGLWTVHVYNLCSTVSQRASCEEGDDLDYERSELALLGIYCMIDF